MAQDMTCRRTKFKHGVDELQRSRNRTKVNLYMVRKRLLPAMA
jgi:hypothetical protein